MRKEQVLLLALLAALFRPALSQDHFEDDEIDDDCHVKTSIVLKKLDTCDSQKIKDDFRRNQLWTDVVKEEIKSQSDEVTKNLDKQLEVALKQAHEDKLEMKASMDRILQSVEANKKQMEDLMMESINGCQRFKASWSLSERNATTFFKTMGRNFYYNKTQYVSWYENRDVCRSRGMQLATFKTAEELKQVANTLTSKISGSYGFWLSASDIGRSAGQFHWADGTPLLESTWQIGQPDNHQANQETCAHIHTGYEKLFDWACYHKFYTLCEVPELLATCL